MGDDLDEPDALRPEVAVLPGSHHPGRRGLRVPSIVRTSKLADCKQDTLSSAGLWVSGACSVPPPPQNEP